MENEILYCYFFCKIEITDLNCVGISAQKVGKIEHCFKKTEYGNDMLKMVLVRINFVCMVKWNNFFMPRTNFTLQTMK